MKNHRRMLEGGATELETQLLSAASDDAPPEGSAQRARLALGLGAAAAGAATTSTATVVAAATSATGTATVAAGAASAVPGALGGGLAPWVFSAIVLVAGGSGVYLAAGNGSSAWDGSETKQIVGAQPAPPEVRAEPEPQPASEPEPEPRPSGAPERVPPPVAPAELSPAVKGGPAPSAPPAGTFLAAEVARIDEARRELLDHDAERALAALDRYHREFPGGRLAPEAAVLQVEALAMRGDRAAAREVARDAINADPDSPHSDRMRRALEAGASPASSR